MNDACLEANVKWSFESTAYGFYFTFYREQNVTANVTPSVFAPPSLNKTEQIFLI